MIAIKILGTKPNLRYSVRRVVQAACQALLKEQPELQFSISEVKDSQEIFAYTQVLVSPALVINEKLVYATWIPTREQVLGWLREAVEGQASPEIERASA
jgi:hypothetical protein